MVTPHLGGGHLDVDDDGCQGGLGQLGRVVDGVSVQHHQLQGLGQLKDAFDLTLHLGWGDTGRAVSGWAGPGRGSLHPWAEPGPSPMLDRVVERSRIACLPRLLRMERLARDRSAVMWVMEILGSTGTQWAPGDPLCGRRGVLGGVTISPAIESVLEEVEEGFLHHVGDLPWGRQPSEPRQMAPAGRWQPLSTLPAALGPAICLLPAHHGQGRDKGHRPPP